MTSILVVDDEPDILELMRINLESRGYYVEVCQSGEEALEKIVGFSPDLLLLDIRLPGISGLDVLRVIRRDPLTHGLKVILFSALSESSIMFENRPDGFLGKPFSKAQLYEMVERVLLRVEV